MGDENPSAEDMKDTIYKLQQRVDGYKHRSTGLPGRYKPYHIEIPGVSDANTILENLANQVLFSFSWKTAPLL